MTLHHKNLNVLAKDKTEVVKKNQIDALRMIIKEEKKQLQAISKLEATLVKETASFLQNNGISTDELTITKVIEAATEVDKEQLQTAKFELENEVMELSKQNRMNQELLEQSLQFINVSLDLLQPEIDSFNYDRNEAGQQDHQTQTRSLFDSKA